MSEKVSAETSLIMVNGQFSDHIAVYDRGFAFADGVFESMRYVAGAIPLLDRHVKRLLSACSALQIPIDKFSLHAQLNTFLSRAKLMAVPLGKIKLTVTRGQGGRGCYPSRSASLTAQTSSLIIHLSPLEASEENDSVRLVSAKQAIVFPPALVGIKHLSRLPYIAAALNETLHGTDELLFYDSDEMVAETMHHNVFFFHKDTVVTPRLTKVGVAGIARDILIDTLLDDLGLELAIEDIPRNEMFRFDGCFIANSVRGLSEVTRIDELDLSCSPHFQKLNARLEKILDNKA